MKQALLLFFFTAIGNLIHAAGITGTVTDNKGNVLPFASILIKGTTKGGTANNEGRYQLNLEPGTYTVVCQYVGYNRQEKVVEVSTETVTLNFQLS